MTRTTPIILTPGPVLVPGFVLEGICRPVIHHRTPEFRKFFAELQTGLQYLFQTERHVVTFPGTGTAGMEMVIRSVFRTGEKVLVANNGKFSGRWADFGKTEGMEVVQLENEWGTRPETDEIVEAVKAHSGLSGIVLTHCETSTGAVIDLEEICLALRRQHPELLIVVDGITTVGVLPFYFDAWGVDAAVVASQKSLLNPAGLAFATLSARAAARLDPNARQDAFRLTPYYDHIADVSYPFTPPTQLLFGVHAALQYFQSETLPGIWNGVHQRSRLTKARLTEMGAELFGTAQGDPLTVFSMPGANSDYIRDRLKTGYNIEIAGGQGQLSSKIARIAHFGYVGIQETQHCLDALTKILSTP